MRQLNSSSVIQKAADRVILCDNNHLLTCLHLGLSIIQNGKLPTFLAEDMLRAVFSRITPLEPCLKALQNGFKEVGIYQVRVAYVSHLIC